MDSNNQTSRIFVNGGPCEPSKHHKFSKMLKCAIDEERFQNMLDNESQYALFYITVILIVYLFGLILLLLHYIWTKNGQISLFDIYLELLHMLPFKHENRTNLNVEIEGATSYGDLRPIPMRLSNFHRGSRDNIMETRYKIERKELKFSDKIATFHDILEEKDHVGEAICNEEKLEEFVDSCKSLTKEQSNRFSDCQKNLAIKNKDRRRLYNITRNPSFDLIPESNEEFEMSLLPAKTLAQTSEKD